MDANEIREDVLRELQEELDYLLAAAPETVTQSTRKSIKGESMVYAKRVVDSLTAAELESETARHLYIEET